MVIKLFSQNVRGGSHKVTFIKNINYIYIYETNFHESRSALKTIKNKTSNPLDIKVRTFFPNSKLHSLVEYLHIFGLICLLFNNNDFIFELFQ